MNYAGQGRHLPPRNCATAAPQMAIRLRRRTVTIGGVSGLNLLALSITAHAGAAVGRQILL
jgi:hypothetical protein